MNGFSSEDELQGEFKLAHTGGGAGGCVMLDIGNNSIAGTIDARSAVLVVVEAEHRMIEHIERIHPELEFQTLEQREILQNRSIRVKHPRSAVAEDPDVA